MRLLSFMAAILMSLFFIMPGPGRAGELDESYYPLKPGMRWEYNVTTGQGGTQKLVITNLPSREIAGKKVTPRKWEMGKAAFYQFMEKDDSGIYRYADQASEKAAPVVITPKECHLRFPISHGNSWVMATKMDGGTLIVNLSIESVSEVVKVPAGSYKDCLKIKQEGENAAGVSVLGYEWYAPKVGVVKSIVTLKMKSKDGKITSENRNFELLSFKP